MCLAFMQSGHMKNLLFTSGSFLFNLTHSWSREGAEGVGSTAELRRGRGEDAVMVLEARHSWPAWPRSTTTTAGHREKAGR